MFSYTLVAFSIALLISSANAAADCTQQPSVVAKNCCKLPSLNKGAFAAQCSAHITKKKDPCFFECMFNVSNVLDGENFNMENARQMVSTVFDGNQEFIDAFMWNFKECELEAKHQLAAYRAKMGSTPKPGDCEMRSFFYVVCAGEMINANCPKSAWTASKECEVAKEIATTCKPLSFFKY